MTKTIRYISFLFLFFQLFGCDTVQDKKIESNLDNKDENVFGLYSYYVKGYHSHCETVKHSLQLNPDSSFVSKIYCYADTTSSFIPTIGNGRWTKQSDSVFHFICNDTTTFDVELLPTKKLKIIRPKIDDRINFDFSKDTTKEEMDWQKRRK